MTGLIFNPKKNEIEKNAISADIAIDENMPKAPRNIRKKRNMSFKTLNIMFFIKTNLAFLKPIKTDSISVKNTYERTKIAKRKLYNLISLRNTSFGLKTLMNKTNIKLRNNATMPDMPKHELIMLLFSFDFEIYLTSAILNPSNENMDINSNEEISVEANPT